jgi:tetratricopeptide (TPR) repeat protein
MGKTSLLRQLAPQATYLLARQGLPFATLEPLLGAKITEGNTVMLRYLSRLEGLILLDGWEFMDSESQELIKNWRTLHSPIQVVITSCQSPAFSIEHHFKLQTLTDDALKPYAGAYEASHGLPMLLGSWLRNEPLIETLEERLSRIPDHVRRVYFALCLLDKPNRDLIRVALNVLVEALGEAWQILIEIGLIEISGQPRATELARQTLHRQPNVEAELSLCLARQVPSLEAFPLYQRARGLWAEIDLRFVLQAYLSWAQTVLDRGSATKCLEVLTEAPEDEAVFLLRARALERMGHYSEALEWVKRCRSLDALALEAKLCWRMGETDRAQELAEKALEGSMPARAEAFNILGQIIRAKGDHQLALEHHHRAATIWHGLGSRHLQAQALNNMAICLNELGKNPLELLDQAYVLSDGNPVMHACIYTNRGMYHWRRGFLEEAAIEFQQATKIEEDVEALHPLTMAWLNLGVIYHLRDQIEEASFAYHHALKLADQIGDRLLQGNLLANLAELNCDVAAWEEAIFLLESTGWIEVAQQHKQQLQAFKLRLIGV